MILFYIIDARQYRRFAGGAARLQLEQYIELFDLDLVRLPPSLPPHLMIGA